MRVLSDVEVQEVAGAGIDGSGCWVDARAGSSSSSSSSSAG